MSQATRVDSRPHEESPDQRQVAETKRLRRALQESEATTDTLLNARATDSTLVLNRSGIILALNEIASKRLGKPVPQLIGRCLYEILYDIHEPEIVERRKGYIGQVFRTGEPARFEDARRESVFDNYVYPIRTPDGEVGRVVVFGRDITERKKAEAEAKLRQEQLVQADKMISLGILVSGVAHEINNPNQFIMSNISLLSKAWEGARPILDEYFQTKGDFSMGGIKYSLLRDRIPDLLDDILNGSDRIRRIVRELRDFARQEPQEMDDEVDLNGVVGSAATLVSKMVRDSTENFQIELSDAMPRIKGNHQRLEQVIINLIINACQALETPEEGIYVSTAFDPNSQSVAVRIKDEGCGIPKEALKRITDPFFTTKRDQGGVGLGLAISDGIVRDHGGTMIFASEPAKGTTASVTLPVNSTKGS